MKLTTKIILAIFTFLLIASIVSYDAEAVPPTDVFTSQSTGRGLVLQISNLPAIKVLQDYTLSIHIYNGTTGYPIYTGASCSLHLYNSTLSEILDTHVSIADGFDYEIPIAASNFSKEGYYPYIASCNTSDDGGYISGYIEATSNGNPKSENPSLLIAFILLPMIFIGLLLYGAMQMGEEHTAIKITTWLLIPIFFFTSMHFALLTIVVYYPIAALQNIIGSSVYWMGIVSGVLITYFLIYFIYKMIQSAAEAKAKKLDF